MQAQQTRAGGRYIAQERGSEEQMYSTPMLTPAPRGMLIERLSAASLTFVAEMLGVQVDELERRYCA